MIERMPLVGPDHCIDTADERWWHGTADSRWYADAIRFAVDHLGPGGNRHKCLVVGSALPEVREIAGHGWRVTHIDIRKPPDAGEDFVCGDATDLPFLSESFDAVSSTCVLCHVGLGRYGDPIQPNGDMMALLEMARVLKSGGTAVLMPGPTIDSTVISESVVYGNVHRIYRESDILDMAFMAGLEVTGSELFPGGEDVDVGGGVVRYSYLSIALRKP